MFYFKSFLDLNIMKTTIEIKSIFYKVLFTYTNENATIKDAVEEAVKQNISLSLANLSSANLRSADLSSANLRSADLSLADLSLANLSSANLRSANLCSADLRSANLSSANLRSANLCSADLRSADLRSAKLSLANLSSANLRSADLSSANLRSADLSSANLRSADLSSANLRSADLSLVKNKEGAYLPTYCRWSHSINGNKIQIGCKTKTIKEWDVFFASDKVYETERNTDDFKQIQAVYESYKAYLNFLNK